MKLRTILTGLILPPLLFMCCISSVQSRSDHDIVKGEDALVFEILIDIKVSLPQTTFEDLKQIYTKLRNSEWNKPYDKLQTKQAFRKFVFKMVSKLHEIAVHSEIKQLSLYSIQLMANHPLGHVADLAQFLLEIAGHDTAGKWVGALGNVAAGYLAGGPVGAAVGLGIWYFGEAVEYETAKYLKYLDPDYLDYLDYF